MMQTRQPHLSMRQVCRPLESTRTLRSEHGLVHSSEKHSTKLPPCASALPMRNQAVYYAVQCKAPI